MRHCHSDLLHNLFRLDNKHQSYLDSSMMNILMDKAIVFSRNGGDLVSGLVDYLRRLLLESEMLRNVLHRMLRLRIVWSMCACFYNFEGLCC